MSLKSFKPAEPKTAKMEDTEAPSIQSQLAQWPVQLKLVPVTAPYLQDADLLIAADCVPFAFADFHRRFLKGKILLIGCPKFDDAEYYQQKLIDMFKVNDIRSIEIVHMEVPCCFGLIRLVEMALAESRKDIPLTITKVGIRGDILESSTKA